MAGIEGSRDIARPSGRHDARACAKHYECTDERWGGIETAVNPTGDRNGPDPPSTKDDAPERVRISQVTVQKA